MIEKTHKEEKGVERKKGGKGGEKGGDRCEARPGRDKAKTDQCKRTRQFTLRMSGELGFSSSMPEGLRGSNTGSGW